jgi:hypothetical protein
VKRLDIYALTVIGASAVLMGGGLAYATMRSDRVVASAAAAAPAAAPAPATATHLYLTIATPKMLGNEMPAYMPANFSVPADSDVVVTITNFDDATALAAGTEQFATATGIKGALSVQAMDPTNPNAVTTAASLMSMDPATVSHTLTVAKLGLNVPIAPKSVTTFTFHSGAAGTYAWQCMDPCGSDPSGWGGAMATAGYMKGGLTSCGGCCC